MNDVTSSKHSATRYLAIYLADHHAGGAGARALLKRMVKSNQGTELAPALRELRAELEVDLRQAERIATALDIAPSPLKDAVAKGAAMIGKLKLNGHMTSYSPLSRLLELEGLRAGVTAKLCMWRALRQIASADGRLAAFELERFERRALDQLERIDDWHAWAVRQLAA
jgi:hypothetical protein